jgi:hypothetical protein
MTFEERRGNSEKMDASLITFLNEKHFTVLKTGYEMYAPDGLKQKLRKVHNDPTVRFLRYVPDYFASLGDTFFFIELKYMDTPIRLDGRIEQLKRISGMDDLTKENVGPVETAAIENYQNLSRIGVKIVLIVYCAYNKNKLLAEWEDKLAIIYKGKVEIGAGNASFTPYTDINLDKMRSFDKFLQDEFGVTIRKSELDALILSISS